MYDFTLMNVNFYNIAFYRAHVRELFAYSHVLNNKTNF